MMDGRIVGIFTRCEVGDHTSCRRICIGECCECVCECHEESEED